MRQWFRLRTVPGWLALAEWVLVIIGRLSDLQFVLQERAENYPTERVVLGLLTSPRVQLVMLVAGLAWIYWFGKLPPSGTGQLLKCELNLAGPPPRLSLYPITEFPQFAHVWQLNLSASFRVENCTDHPVNVRAAIRIAGKGFDRHELKWEGIGPPVANFQRLDREEKHAPELRLETREPAMCIVRHFMILPASVAARITDRHKIHLVLSTDDSTHDELIPIDRDGALRNGQEDLRKHKFELTRADPDLVDGFCILLDQAAAACVEVIKARDTELTKVTRRRDELKATVEAVTTPTLDPISARNLNECIESLSECILALRQRPRKLELIEAKYEKYAALKTVTVERFRRMTRKS